ncbi:MAG: ribosomal protein S18-alanine N-acetyltransferase [Eubacterium sp.]|nr:ribosomal protein S18-alanine N-acetyltransferase [Eubacterium sp.]
MVQIREMTLADVGQVYDLEKSIFSIPWSKESFENSIKGKDTLFIVAEEEGKISGYLGMYLMGEEADISNVAVSKECRRQHIAQRLLEYIFAQAKTRGVRNVTLEVRETNVAAICLYENMGFCEAGIRKNYYKEPIENALIMWKQNL